MAAQKAAAAAMDFARMIVLPSPAAEHRRRRRHLAREIAAKL
jgi:hypothetical protein